jgi:hypothetical protein
VRVAVKAFSQEVNALFAQLLLGGKLRWVSLSDVVHNRPFVIQASPRTTSGSHLEDDAPERPDIDRTVAAQVCPSNYFG